MMYDAVMEIILVMCSACDLQYVCVFYHTLATDWSEAVSASVSGCVTVSRVNVSSPEVNIIL